MQLVTFTPDSKRSASSRGVLLPQSKRTHQSAGFNAEELLIPRLFVKVHFDPDYTRGVSSARVSPALFKELFSSQDTEVKYIKIANTVCQCFMDVCMQQPRTIDLDQLTFDEINEELYKEGTAASSWITPFKPDRESAALLSKVKLKIFPWGELNGVGGKNEKKSILSSAIEAEIRFKMNAQVLRLGQKFFVNHSVLGPLSVVVENWDMDGVSKSDSALFTKLPYHGLFNQDTKLNLVSGDSYRLVLVDELPAEKILKFSFTITKIIDISAREFSSSRPIASPDAWKKGAKPLPLMLPLADIAGSLRQRLTNNLILPEHEETIQIDSDWKYAISLTKVIVRGDDTIGDEIDEAEENLKAFRLTEDHAILVAPNKNVILTTTAGDAAEAKEATFELIDKDHSRALKENELNWISKEDLADRIRSSRELLAVGGKLVIEGSGGKFLLELKKVSGDRLSESENANIKDLWEFSSKTAITVYSNPKVDVAVVDFKEPLPILQAKVKVSTPSVSVSALARMLGIEEEGGAKVVIAFDELEKLFKEAVPKSGHLFNQQTLSTLTGKGQTVKFQLSDITTREKKPQGTLDLVYSIVPETKIVFEAERGGELVIATKPKDISTEDVSTKLIELGIGGLSDQFKDIVTKIILSRSTYAEHTKALGQSPPRGLLLYGQPGTGKTILARKLGELLGVTKERIHLYTGSQVWSKWLGDSEKKVREMFADARDDQKKFGKDSPLHLLIIDEIDAFLRDRSNAQQRYETSVLNTFLAELDGISSEGEESLDNIVVVGLTNYPDKIDEAVLRPGRLGTKIHIGIPDGNGRKEIFGIHLKSLSEKGFLSEDVSLDELAKMTVGRTGAFIEGMVSHATGYSLRRLFDAEVAVSDIANHPAAKVTLEDFKSAYQDVIHKDKKTEANQFSPRTELVTGSIASDLQALGLGGLGNEVLEFLLDLKISSYYSNYLSSIKHTSSRGALLYGPSGVGKTSLAKAIKKLFCLDGPRFQYYNASQLWPLQGNHLKERIEMILKPAQDAAKDLKDEAPLHVVVIDGIDSIYINKKETDLPDSSVLNQFLTELDPFFEGNECKNLLVIGIAHRNFELSDAILRNGRFGRHILMKPPTARGRMEIFKIYLESYILNSRISKDFDLEELVKMTDGTSGAYIQGLISQAVLFSMRRAASKGVMPHELGTSQLALLTMDDFHQAREVMVQDDKWKHFYV
ncbi:AAA family ATPase [Estrella lausannensis]|uniref:AAA family ATPase n=1 Tax=Estrella lausannensis TaxID=483423 RepID=A0A0H5DRT9_9BACT|nr:AAA family ATPase [Estrella lausannensis]CRX39431.1 AAA family ATPase [Estrella lausannensis]